MKIDSKVISTNALIKIIYLENFQIYYATLHYYSVILCITTLIYIYDTYIF